MFEADSCQVEKQRGSILLEDRFTLFMKKTRPRVYRFLLLTHTIVNHPLVLLALQQEKER